MTITAFNVDLDEVFALEDTTTAYGDTITEILPAPENFYAPYVEYVDGKVEIDSDDWRIVPGLSSQVGIDNGIMHPSEMFHPAMLKTHRALTGDRYFVLTEVVDAEDWDNLIGWVVLARKS